MSRIAFRLAAATLLLAYAAPLHAAEIRLPRHPDYSDGQIVFSYLGDLWLVNDDGTNPRRLTVHAARDVHPQFSPDGKWIAFSSNRYGNHDVFVMPAERRRRPSGSPSTAPPTPSSAGRAIPSASSSAAPAAASTAASRACTTCRSTAAWSSRCRPTGALRVVLARRQAVRLQPPSDRLVAQALSRQLRRRPVGARPRLEDLPQAARRRPARRREAEQLLADVRQGCGLLRLRPRDAGQGRQPGSPEVGQQHLEDAADGGEPVQVTQHTSGSLFWPSMSADGKVDRLRGELRPVEARREQRPRRSRSKSRSTSSPTSGKTTSKR